MKPAFTKESFRRILTLLAFIAFGVRLPVAKALSGRKTVPATKGRAAAVVAMMALAAVISGCTPVQALQPLYTDRDVVTDDWLEGAWHQVDSDEKTTWVFQPDGDKGYQLNLISSKDKTSTAFSVHLVRLEGQLFLDAQPKLPADAEAFSVPTHLIGRIRLERDEIHIRMLGDDWVTPRAKQGTLGLPFAPVSGPDERVLLTASTAQLQQFVVMHAGDNDAFALEQHLRRWK
jgi:hypothetical protein